MQLLTAASLVCRSDPRLLAAGARVSSFLDASDRFSRDDALTRASAAMLERVLTRDVAASEPLVVCRWVWTALQRVVLAPTQLPMPRALSGSRLPLVQCLVRFAHPSRSLWGAVVWAIQARDFEVLQWLYAAAIKKTDVTPAVDDDVLLREAVASGDVAVVQWVLDQRLATSASTPTKHKTTTKKPLDLGLIAKGLSPPSCASASDADHKWRIVELLLTRLGLLAHRSLPVLAAQCGRLATIQKMQQHAPTAVATSTRAMANAAGSRGHFHIVQHLGVTPTDAAMDDAVLEGDLAVLERLHRQFGCSVTSVGVLRAADTGHVTALQWLHTTFPDKPFWRDLDGLLMPAFSAAVERGHVAAMAWLYETLLQPALALSETAHRRRFVAAESVYLAVQLGDLNVVQFVHEHDLMALDAFESGNAAYYCTLPALQWLHANALLGEPRNELTSAVFAGRLDCIQWILATRTREDASNYAVEYAAMHGRLDVLALLHAHGLRGSARTLDFAAARGHVQAMRFVVDHAMADGATPAAIHAACLSGHLDVVAFLTETHPTACTSTALDAAASKGFLALVQYLHTNRTEGCTVFAMDDAAANGDMDVVAFLHTNRTEGCSPAALEGAAANGHLEMCQFLVAQYPSTFSARAAVRARAKGELETALWLEQCSAAMAHAGGCVPIESAWPSVEPVTAAAVY